MSWNILELTDQNFEQIVSESKKPVLIDFWAPWCGPCRMLTPILENMSVEYWERITFAKINVDENPTAAIRFNINWIPTVLIFKDWKVFKEVIWVRSADEYKVMFEDVLKLSWDIESKIPNIINVKWMSDFQSHISKPWKVVLVDFWAPWCGPCRMLWPVLEKLLETHSDNLVVLKVNVEEPWNQELAANYWVSSIPHVNIMKDGKHVDQFIWALPYETIEQYIKKYM